MSYELFYYLQGLNSSPWTPKNMKKTGRRKRRKKKKGKGGKKHRRHKKTKKRARKSKTKHRVLGSNSLSPKKLNKYKSKKPKHFADLKTGFTSNSWICSLFSFPWMCSLKEAGFSGRHRCGVTLLSGLYKTFSIFCWYNSSQQDLKHLKLFLCQLLTVTSCAR